MNQHEEQIRELYDKFEMLDQLVNGVYIPRKKDVIDEMLSQTINSYPERNEMKIMFLRESEGVYTFGSKRVYIKIDKGQILCCRVGGGFISVHDFIR